MRETNEKGITLIALVITIIILLILAGVSIAMLTGQNGILTQVQKAKTETYNSQEEELRKLTAIEATINLENTTYEDRNGQTVPIPAGFAVSQVEGENTIEDGLVIIDSKGNEFVWIPVTDTYERNTTYKVVEVSETAYTDIEYLPEGIQPMISEEIVDEQEIGLLNEAAERQVVLKAGGFYISRYEAGIDGSDNLISKKGATVWNGILPLEAKKISKTFINNENVKSALCSGVQWDMTMKFINKKQDGTGNTYDVAEYSEPRHTKKLDFSGQNISDKVCNIYDLEGNCYEYIAEKNSRHTSNPFVTRGGQYGSTGSSSNRGYYYDGANTNLYSFRFVLYVI